MVAKKSVTKAVVRVAPPPRPPVKAPPPKPTIVDHIPPGWYPSTTAGPPPRPVDAPSGPAAKYRLFSIPDPSGKKGKRMPVWMKSSPDRPSDASLIPLATGRPKGVLLPKSPQARKYPQSS